MNLAHPEFDEPQAIAPPTDEQILAKLKTDIEALSEGQPMWSRSVYTHRRTTHVTFVNGAKVLEMGEYTYPTDDLVELAQAQLTAIKGYRNSIADDVDLVWRCEPEVRRDGEKVVLYTRLCFEPTLCCVANGVWVENRLAERHGAFR